MLPITCSSTAGCCGWRARSLSFRRSMTDAKPAMRAACQPAAVIHSGAADRHTRPGTVVPPSTSRRPLDRPRSGHRPTPEQRALALGHPASRRQLVAVRPQAASIDRANRRAALRTTPIVAEESETESGLSESDRPGHLERARTQRVPVRTVGTTHRLSGSAGQPSKPSIGL
jgi:hypothetical protein